MNGGAKSAGRAAINCWPQRSAALASWYTQTYAYHVPGPVFRNQITLTTLPLAEDGAAFDVTDYHRDPGPKASPFWAFRALLPRWPSPPWLYRDV